MKRKKHEYPYPGSFLKKKKRPDAAPLFDGLLDRVDRMRAWSPSPRMHVFFWAILGLVGIGAAGVALLVFLFFRDMPTDEQLGDPHFRFVTIAYTADGKELARYGLQNRSWVGIDRISPHVLNALIATEDHRFYQHGGIDLFRTISAVIRTAMGDRQGGSTITQQLARNMFEEKIGFEVSPRRKLREMATAVALERRYSKPEILELYLNTVAFSNNAWGIEGAARTYFGKSAAGLNVLESATLVGMLQATTRYNPKRNPEASRLRRNVVLGQMVRHGYLSSADFEELKDIPVETRFSSTRITDSFAPYFAEYVRNWLGEWAKTSGRRIYTEGLIVRTTLDSQLQQLAEAAVQHQMEKLQAVVNVEWSRPDPALLSSDIDVYVNQEGYEPFAYFWRSQPELVRQFIRETPRFQALRTEGLTEQDAAERLLRDRAFIDSLKAEKTRLEAGLVSIDPQTGFVKAWVGGRNLATDWYDHVAKARRQPGSTFKPFVYAAAIDNGYPPDYQLPDNPFTWTDPKTHKTWNPGNFGGASGQMLSLREALAMSTNLVSARVITQLTSPNVVAWYAKRMGIDSPLEQVPSLALGTSEVTLFELVSAYTTLATGGIRREPVVVTRIEEPGGRVLYEAQPESRKVLSPTTAYAVVDMMRGVVNHPRGTATRLNWQFELSGYDLAAKTGTTQENADGWFMLLHPRLVTGAWVGFNDRRVRFRSPFWGQGAHNALFLVGDYFRSVTQDASLNIGPERFPAPDAYGFDQSGSRWEGIELKKTAEKP